MHQLATPVNSITWGMNSITPFIPSQVGLFWFWEWHGNLIFSEVECEDFLLCLQHLVDELTTIGEEMSCQAECIQIIQDRWEINTLF